MYQLKPILYGCFFASFVGAQNLPNQFQPQFTVERPCFNSNSQCNLKVALQCVYRNSNGEVASCLDQNLNTNRPFLTLSKAECSARGAVLAKIRYRICNENSLAFTPISFKNDVRFRGRSVKPSNWDNALPANQCREHLITENIDLCNESRVVDVEMDGNLAKARPNYCRCYLYKEANVDIYTPSPTPAPTKFPSRNPTDRPSTNPTNDPTGSPTPRPSPRETERPTPLLVDPIPEPQPAPTPRPPSQCKYFFTELSDPLDDDEAGFVEIRTTCPGMRIPDDLYIITWKSTTQKVFLRQIIDFPTDGFVIICKNRSTFVSTYRKVCDIENAAIQPDGLYSIALIGNNRIYDIYGIIGQMLPSVFVCKDGRAYRDINASSSSHYFIPNFWHIIPGNTIGSPNAVSTDMDPREWKANELQLFFTELADPYDDDSRRFIELYSPNRRNYIIRENLYIFRHDATSSNVIGWLHLGGVRIDGNGFAVLCVTNWTNKCTAVTGYQSIVYSPGIYSFTLQKCANGPTGACVRIDSYGVGQFSIGYSYENGRAVRSISAQPRPSYHFYLHHWYVFQRVTSIECDPGEWEDEDEDNSGITPPAPTPPVRPSKGKGKSPSKKRIRL